MTPHPESRTKVIVVPHGKSEIVLCKQIAQRLQRPIAVFSPTDGETAIKLEHLESMFREAPFDSDRSLVREFRKRLDYRPGTEDVFPGLRIFPIMDIDHDHVRERSYITGNMFKGCHFEKRIVPIYNRESLDEVIGRCMSTEVQQKKVRTYHSLMDRIDVTDLYYRLRADPGTNMDEFILHLMRSSPAHQSRVPVKSL